ncbi:MAG: DUF2138 family protein [Pseudomonadota bacterium]
MVGKKKVAAGVAALAVLVGVGLGVYKGMRPRFDGAISALAVDLAAPYAYVSTPALSRLPRDIIKAPVVRDLLTEDFAFYYEEQEDRLSLRGALKRIAYEHETTLSDQLVATALDEPAEMAWWPDAKGAPRYWMLAMTRGVLATALQGMAGVAAQDSQLSIIAPVRVNGSDVNAYALVLSPRRTLVLLSQGNRVVVLSDPGLLFGDEKQPDGHALEVVAGLLSGDRGKQSAWRRGFGLGEANAEAVAGQGGSTIVADARLLSFGYQHFFPGIQALRFDVAANGASLRTALRVKGGGTLPAAPGDRALWSALPADPAACTLLPAEWAQMEGVMAGATSAEAKDGKDSKDGKDAPRPPDAAAWKAFTAQLEGPAAVCWYARSQLHTPLFVAQTKADAGSGNDAVLAALARWIVPAKASALDAAAPQGAALWRSEVEAPWGPANDGYQPTLARQGRWIMFSPDDKLVDLALNTQAKRYPSVLDALPQAAGTTLAVGAPAQIAKLLQREAFAVLPADQEVLLQAARQHLVPRFDALRKLPPARAVASGAADGNGWVPVDWQTVAAAQVPQGK